MLGNLDNNAIYARSTCPCVSRGGLEGWEVRKLEGWSLLIWMFSYRKAVQKLGAPLLASQGQLRGDNGSVIPRGRPVCNAGP